VSGLSSTDVVRRIFDARASGDVRRFMTLVDPDVEVQALPDSRVLRGSAEVADALAREASAPRRVEVEGHRFDALGDDVVLVTGRVRIITPQGFADSPAAWSFQVRCERVLRVTPARAARPLRQVA
jgi:ketosteroid isomerase-like protein